MAIEARIGEKKIEVVVDDFAEFVARYTPFISRDGVLVHTEESLPKGLDVELVFRLADGFVLIAGRGMVAWTQPASEDRPAGVGLHFLVIEDDSQELVDRIVSNHVADGGQPFDVDLGPAGAGESAVDSEPTVVGRIPEELKRHDADGEAPAAEGQAPSEVIKEEGVDALEEADGPVFAPGMSSADMMKGSTRPEMPENVSSLLDPSGKPETLDLAAVETPGAADKPDLGGALESLEVDLERGTTPGDAAPSAAQESVAADSATGAEGEPEGEDDASLDDMLRELSEELGDEEEEEPIAEPASAAAVEDATGDSHADGDQGADAALDEEVDLALRAIRLPGEEGDEPRPSTQVMPPPDMLEEEGAAGAEPASADDTAGSIVEEDDSSAALEDEVDLALDAIGPQSSAESGQHGGPLADSESGRLLLDLDEEDSELSSEPGAADYEPVGDEVELELPDSGGYAAVNDAVADDDEIELDFGPGIEEEESPPDWAAKTLEESSADAEIDLGDGSEIDLGFSQESSETGYDAALALELPDRDDELQGASQLGGISESAPSTFPPLATEDSAPSPLQELDKDFEAPIAGPDSGPTPTPTPTPAPALTPPPVAAAGSGVAADSRPARSLDVPSESLSLQGAPAVDYLSSEPKRRRRRQRIQFSRLVPLLLLLGLVGGLYLAATRVFPEEYALLRAFLFSEETGPVARVSLEDGLQIQAGEARPLRDLDQEEGSDPRVVFQDDSAVQRPVTVIENVMWEREQDATVIDLWGNGVFAPSAVGYLRIDGDRPREVLKIRGITRPFWQAAYRLQTPEIRRLRFGYHLGQRVGEVHMVIDLADPAFRVTDLVAQGNRLMIRVAR